ncbi:MAG: hypothetical protein ACTSXU_15660, partial [Promethearchaeota archaeon]
SDTVEPGIYKYESSEIVPEFSTSVSVTINIVNLTVYNDHDGIGEGDFHVLIYNGYYNPNHEQIWQPVDRDGTLIGYYEDVNFFSVNFYFYTTIFNGSWVGIGLYDDDAGTIDYIGTDWIWAVTPYNYSEHLANNISTTLNFNDDVLMGVDVSVIMDAPLTAEDVALGYLPYMFSDIDISIPDPRFEDVYSRLLKGYDPTVDREVFSVQTVFYWSIERMFSGDVLHYNDFELMQIYIDPSVSWLPYRIAFDSGFYTSGSMDGDSIWWKCHAYTIYEDTDFVGHGIGDYGQYFNISSLLKPFLGDRVWIPYNISSYDTAFYSYSNIRRSPTARVSGIGVIVPVITLETFYHTFDRGLPNGGTEYGFLTPYFNWLSDAKIKEWYGILEDSFLNGTHSTSGDDTPWVQPLSWDLANPFYFPLVSNYDDLVNNIAAYNDAKNSRLFSVKKVADFTYHVSFPLTYAFTLPSSIQQGTSNVINGTLSYNSSLAFFKVEYEIGIIVTIDLGYYEKVIPLTLSGYIEVGSSGLKIGFGSSSFIIGSQSYEFSGDYLDVDLDLTPRFLGVLLNGSLTFNIFDFLQSSIPVTAPYINLFKMILGDLIFETDFEINGAIQADLFLNDENIKTMLFDGGSTTISFLHEFVPETNEIMLKLSNFKYMLNFKARHYLCLEFARWIEFFFGESEIEYFLGTWPNLGLNFTLFSGDLVIYNSSS